MILTVHKDKLPRTLAYPTGAQALTQSLQKVPQADQMEIWFTRNVDAASEKNGLRLVITTRYEMTNLGMSAARNLVDSGFYGPNWNIRVWAVPRELNARIRGALNVSGYATIARWLCTARSDLWLASSHRCTLYYCLDQDSLVHHEADH